MYPTRTLAATWRMVFSAVAGGPPRRPREVGHDPRGHGLLQRSEQLRRGTAGQRAEALQVELPPQDRGQGEHLGRVTAEVGQASADHLADAFGDGGRPLHRGGRADPPLAGQEAHDLDHEERVSLRLLVHGGDQPAGRARAGGELDEPGHVVPVEPSEVQPAGHGGPAQLGQGDAQRVVPFQGHVPEAPDHQEPRLGDLPGQEPQQQQRGRIGGVQVVEHEDQRFARRRGDQEPGGDVEETEPRGLGVQRGGSGRFGSMSRSSEMIWATSAAPAPSSRSNLSGSRPRIRARIDWTHGQYAGAPPASQQRPHSTRAPRSRAIDPSSSASLLFPIPGSPASRNRRPSPARAASSPSTRAVSSASRPTKTEAPDGPGAAEAKPPWTGFPGVRRMARSSASIRNRRFDR